jgi:hypothetical protein
VTYAALYGSLGVTYANLLPAMCALVVDAARSHCLTTYYPGEEMMPFSTRLPDIRIPSFRL